MDVQEHNSTRVRYFAFADRRYFLFFQMFITTICPNLVQWF